MQLFKMFATLGLNSQEFNQGLDEAQSKAGGFGQAIGGIGKLAVGAFAAAGTAVVAFGKQSIDVGKVFDSSMSQLAATMGTTVDQIGDLSDKAKELGRTTQFSASQAADGMNILAMAGYNAEQITGSLGDVLNLAAAGGLSIADAADYATGIIAGFGKTVEDTATVTNYLAVMASSAKGDVASFGEGLSTVSGMARTTGQSMEDMAVALEILGNNNFSASEGGNALSRTLKNLYQSTDSAAKALDGLGVSAYDADGNARALPDVLRDLNAALDGLTDEQKNLVLSQIFDAATLKSVPALMNGVNESWDELAEGIANADGAAGEMAATMNDNLKGDTIAFGSALEGVQIALSEQLTPAMREFVQYGTSALSTLTDAFTNGGLEGVFDALPGVLSQGIGMIMSGIPQVIKISKEILSALLKGLYDNLPIIAQGAVEIVSMLATTIIESVPDIMQAGTDIITSLSEGLVEGIPAFLEQALPMLLSFTDNLRANFGTIVDAGIQFILNLVDGIIEALPTLWENIPQIVSNIAGLVNDNAPKLLGAGIELIARLITGIVNSIPLILSNFGTIVQMAVDVFLAFNWINLGMQLIDFIVSGVKALISALPDVISNIGQSAWDALSGIDWIDLGGQLIELICYGVNTLFTSLGDLLVEVGNDAWEAMKDIDWLDLGSKIIDGVVDGLSSAGGAIKDKLIGLGKDAWEGVKNFFGIKSPSRLMRDTVGKMIPLGLAAGIDAEADAVTDAMDRLGDLSMDAVDINGVNGDFETNRGGYNQVVNIYSPTELTPSEVARQTRNATRDMVLALNGV